MKLFLDTNVLLDHALNRATGQPLEISYLMLWTKVRIFLYIFRPAHSIHLPMFSKKTGCAGKIYE